MYVQRVSCKRSGEYTWKKKTFIFQCKSCERSSNRTHAKLSVRCSHFFWLYNLLFLYLFFHLFLSILNFFKWLICSLVHSFRHLLKQISFFLLCIAIELVVLPLQMISGNAVFFFVSRMDQKMSTNHNKYKQFRNPQFVLALSQTTSHLFGEVFFVRC